MAMSSGRHTAPSRTATVTRPQPQPVPALDSRPGEKVYRPGLDGLRALAVIGVLLYHAGVHWMPGGLLGVDLFFVISGFLITSLLIAEVQRSGGIALVAFYGRRARRLLPALAAVLAFTVGIMALFHPGDLVRFKGDLFASVGYVTNWWFIVHHQSYFVASGRPSPFQQLWSLAVEEQFYILWPLGFLALGGA
jgi:peptidoglycan/LPS O-acetylase OafA/YrhL